MALGTLPPWLATNPSSFTQAAEGGARLGLEAKSQADSQADAVAGQQLQAQAQQKAAVAQQQQLQLSQQAQQLEQERMAAQQAEAQQRLRLETQTAARKFQAQQGYAQAVAGGADPVHAMLQFGPQMGESLAGLGPLSLSQYRMHQASVPPAPVMGEDGKPVGYTYAGNMHMLPKTTQPKVELPEKLSELDKMAAAAAHAELQTVNKEESSNASIPDAGTARSLMNRRKKAEDTLEEIGKKYGEDEDKGSDSTKKPQGVRVRNKKTGQMGTLQSDGTVIPDDESGTNSQSQADQQ